MTRRPSLRSILGGSRIKKRSSSTKRSSSSTSSSSAWTSSLARTKPGGAVTSKLPQPPTNDSDHGRLEDDLSPSPLPPLLSTTTTTRNPIASNCSLPSNPFLQVHHHILTTMFEPFPPNGAGLGSARIASAARFRAAVPPLVSVAHLQAQLLATRGLAASPAAAERAMAALVRAGLGRKVVIPTLRGMSGRAGELFVSSEALGRMVTGADVLDSKVKERFEGWLQGNPAAVRIVDPKAAGFEASEVDALVRAGFLTAAGNEGGRGGGKGLYARPEERYAMISLEAVSRAAAGSVAAVGGEGALHAAGGTGARNVVATAGSGAVAGEFSIAVPGSGVFLKLVSAALEQLAELLQKSQYREMSESDLREKWDGGVVGSNEVALAKKARGEFAGVLPGRTKKWKEFHGLAFDWVLQEAVGAGLVEVFDTRSVGRGVRLV
ncbi:serine-threonine protein kinase 19-domain-containing protein [Achaetomium macrosporum]|uniref:Serine-threonine protein kinase 19-domain-containing protein n=1 Tax=Achaetomium macrosporum TaxID=79813 RepID=A0AAN7CAE8_9PEZI|nr:serine-threonine protein kinase 19-domain-containing protein [Achaetomium macrosporum]